MSLQAAILDLKRFDLFANGSSPLHRLDPRAKVLTTGCFILAVVSFNRYELTPLFPFFIFPIAMVALGGLPALFILRKVALVCPLVLLVAIFNPILDREVVARLGTLDITAGWLSLCSILIKSLLTVGTALVLVGTTGFTAICRALEKLGMPRAFVVQLQFLYRYIFVLAEETKRAAMARQLRACGRKGLGVNSYGNLVGHLLLRTWQRAERVHMAMLARGFRGEFCSRTPFRFGGAETLFVTGWLLLFVLLRLHNLPLFLGSLITELFS